MAAEMTHVLVVDDEPAIVKALAQALTRSGFRTSTALSSETAMQIVRGEHVDVLVLDLRIGDLRGDALFELAAAIQPHLRTRTLFTTGDITERAQNLIEACKCSFLRKPFDLKELIDWVKSVEPKAKDQSA